MNMDHLGWFHRLCAISLAAACLMAVPGCLAVGSSTEKKNVPTVGQQLQDLKSARDSGAINDQEYAAGKNRLLNSLP